MRQRLDIQRVYTLAEYERIALGFVPREMEDKWFIFLEADRLYLHRSWTGLCIYEVRLAACAEGHAIAEAWVNRDPEQHMETSDEYDAKVLLFLIDRLLLGHDAHFPGHPGTDAKRQALHRWSQLGDARGRDEPLPERFKLLPSSEEGASDVDTNENRS